MAIKLVCSVDDEQLKSHYEINKDDPAPWITKLKTVRANVRTKFLSVAAGHPSDNFILLSASGKGIFSHLRPSNI